MGRFETNSLQWLPARTVTLTASASSTVRLEDRDHLLDLGGASMLALQARVWAQVDGAHANVSGLKLLFEQAADVSDSMFAHGLSTVELDIKPDSSTMRCPYTKKTWVPTSSADCPPLRYWRHRVELTATGPVNVTLTYELFARVSSP